MTRRPVRLALSLALSLSLSLAATAPAAADEGMWLFNEFPFARFEKEHGFRPDQEFLDRLRLASVRFNNGGSGSFVSPRGLTLTNHHVGSECIQKLSSAERDLMADGFVARTPEEELPCPDFELNVLQSIERVTDRVRGAGAGQVTGQAHEARQREVAAIEKECHEATGLRCDVVTLYEGGEYDLYRYKPYTDVRLAFAPELQLASFGGDPDNFEYPRFCLDFALFRVYEDGKAAATEHFLPADPGGPREGEVAFLSGNPGSTGRLETVAQLRWLRDTSYPDYQKELNLARERLLAFSALGDEQARIAQDDLLSVENSLKAVSGYLSGLLDDELMATKAAEEEALRAAVAAGRVSDVPAAADPWSEIARALATYRTFYPRYRLMERDLPRAGLLATTARRLVRLAYEREKPNGERLAAYRESALPSLYHRLYTEAPIYREYETARLGWALRDFLSQYGPTHPLVAATLDDRSPEEVAAELVRGTGLGDVTARKALAEGGRRAIEDSPDPLIRFFRTVEPRARWLTERFEDQVEAVEEEAGAAIARAHFAVHGRETYPDATFSLRVSFGRVEGYREGGREIPWHTVFGGLFDRAAMHDFEPPYELPDALAAARERVDRGVAVDFVSTHDIIGGNSGSPVVDREGRLIGVVFDGNLHMLPNRFRYTEEKSRAISVDVRGMLEVLRRIYPARHLAEEMLGGGGG